MAGEKLLLFNVLYCSYSVHDMAFADGLNMQSTEPYIAISFDGIDAEG